jgi:hypothetical protein
MLLNIIGMLRKEYPEFISGSGSPDQNALNRLAERAEHLLDAVDRRLDRSVHAYQLFSPGGPRQSAREISKLLVKAGWKKGLQHVSIRSLIKKILIFAEQEVEARRLLLTGYILEHPQGHHSVEKICEKIDGNAILLVDQLGLRDAVTDPEALERAIASAIKKQISTQLRISNVSNREENAGASIAIHHFMEFVCGFRTVAEFEARPPMLVRPYELFLFAHQQGLYEEKLTMPFSSLQSDVIQPSVKSSLTILETHGYAEGEIESWNRKNDPDAEMLTSQFFEKRNALNKPIKQGVSQKTTGGAISPSKRAGSHEPPETAVTKKSNSKRPT